MKHFNDLSERANGKVFNMENLILKRKPASSTSDGIFQFRSEKFQQLSLVERFEAEALPHLPVLKRIALHLVRNQSQAEDLVQETFAQALKSFNRYESGTNCRGWLCKIMFNKRSQWIRTNARFCQFAENESQFPAVTYANMLPPDFMSKKLTLALNAVPDKFRQIIWLSVVEEFTYSEIATRLQIPIGTVMSRLHRGRKMLCANFSQFSDSTKLASHNRNN
jgi:RNA polymerase sigma-70 factor, ECF subfamily